MALPLRGALAGTCRKMDVCRRGKRTELGVSDRQRNFLLIFDRLEEVGKTRGDLSLDDGGNFFQSRSSAVELLESLELQPVARALEAWSKQEKKSFYRPLIAHPTRGIVRSLETDRVEEENENDLQIGHALGGLRLGLEVVSLEELLVLGLEQGIARAGLGEDEKGHRGQRRLSAVRVCTGEQRGGNWRSGRSFLARNHGASLFFAARGKF